MINTFHKPTWLLVNENGSIGEARTKAMLLDRFWVLERSVDIEGADFIVEKQSGRHMFSRGSRPMALVQAKFLQDEKTALYIDPDYILDDKQQPWPGFFLIAHSGRDDQRSIFFLTAKQIIDNFKPVEAEKRHAGKYRVSGVDLLTNRYAATNERILTTIEKALETADLEKNRAQMQSILPIASDNIPVMLNRHNLHKAQAISENDFETLRKLVNDWKGKASTMVPKLQLLSNYLETICETLDPLEAVYAADNFEDELRNLPTQSFYKYTQQDSDYSSIQEDYDLASSVLFSAYVEKFQLESIWKNFEVQLRNDLANVLTPALIVSHDVVILKMDIDGKLGLSNYEADGSPNYNQKAPIDISWTPYNQTFKLSALTSCEFGQKYQVFELINAITERVLTEVKRFLVSQHKYYAVCNLP